MPSCITGWACIMLTANIYIISKLLQRLLIIIVISGRGLTSHSALRRWFWSRVARRASLKSMRCRFSLCLRNKCGPNDHCPKGMARRPNSLTRISKFSDDCISRYIVSAGCWFDFEKKSSMIQRWGANPQASRKLRLCIDGVLRCPQVPKRMPQKLFFVFCD